MVGYLSFNYVLDYKTNIGIKTNLDTQQVSFTEEQLVEAVLIGDLDKVKEIMSDPNMDVNAKENDE